MKVRFITSNDGKVREMERLLSSIGHQVVQEQVPYPEIQADTLEAVIDFSLDWLRERVEAPFLIEDSGLFIAPLDNFPGVYSKFVFTTVGLDGVLKIMEGKDERNALFRSCMGYMDERGEKHIFKGECKGDIIEEQRGSNGFGYDPIFVAEGESMTFAEMSTEEKNSISHRSRAAASLMDYLKKN